MTTIGSDQQYLSKQYKTDQNLATRIRTHKLYTQPKVDWETWVLDHIDWTGSKTVIDVGCGSGTYIEEVLKRTPHYTACDLSHGMLQTLTQAGFGRINLDAHILPFQSNSADILFANHMIYHVARPAEALDEFARILKPQGKLLAATNSKFSMREFTTLTVTAAKRLGALEELIALEPDLYSDEAGDLIGNAFSLENGRAILNPHFASVALHILDSALVFSEPDPVITYLATAQERREQGLKQIGRNWHDLASAMYTILTEHIAEHGEFRVNKQTCLFIAHNH